VLTKRELQEFNRQQLDIWFEGQLVIGNRLEFRDGLFSGSDIVPLIPSEFSGTLHLGNCHSTLVQRILSAPRYRVVAGDEKVTPLTFIELYTTTVSLLCETDLSYIDLWIKVLTDLRGKEPGGRIHRHPPIGIRRLFDGINSLITGRARDG
jgi:hypothetical protein